MEHAFGQGDAYRLGMEEELLLVDASSLALAHRASEIVPAIQVNEGTATFDVYEALVETSTPVVESASDGARVLADLRQAIRDAGATLLGAGIHPDGPFGEVVHVPRPRYAAIAESMRGLLSRTPTCAVHVHVGMPSHEAAITALNGMRAHLPVLQALAANSPFWHGLDSGLQSARAQLFRGFPRGIVPPEFADWEDYCVRTEEMVRAADAADYTYLWWDVRPHPRLGTLEVRAMDAQSRLGSVAGLGALIHGLVIAAAEGEGLPARVPSSEALVESSFRAARDGLEATVLWEGELRPIRSLVESAVDVARAYADDPALEEIERIVRDGNGADRQRAAFARGGMRAMLEGLRDEALEAVLV